VPTLRSRGLLAAAALACGVAGCGGGEDYANKPRPATPINVTAAISPDKVSVSPNTFGAGPIVMIVSNQTKAKQTVTIETEELGGSQPGLRRSTEVGPNGTGTLKVDVRKGTYAVSTRGRGIEPANLTVGNPRKSAQDELLQP
jgi:hypothetical protein